MPQSKHMLKCLMRIKNSNTLFATFLANKLSLCLYFKMMNKHINTLIKSSTGAQSVDFSEEIQSLWSGYGSIVRYALKGASHNTVIVKHVRLPKGNSHPRGWNTDYSHHRKIKSYEVETSWYSQYASMCDEKCRIPKIFAIDSINNEIVMVMEDLDNAGFALRLSSVTLDDMELCLRWLANFHATFMNTTPDQLWEKGTYWHLETRPDELKTLDDKILKNAASLIDLKLNNARYQTFVHGDAKLANFCFSNDKKDVAAVDFQYVGGGCGMKDVAYFIGSCLYE